MTQKQTIKNLVEILGKDKVLTNERKTEFYRSGFRSGKGEALAVLFPESLVEYWKVLEVCVAANCIIIMQAAKTGLTEGSTPTEKGYDRDVVVINTLRMDDIVLLNNGCLLYTSPSPRDRG